MEFQGETMASRFDSTRPAPNGVLGVVEPPDRAGAFAKARRRSGRVRFLRKAILAGVLAAVAAMVAIAIFNPFAAKFGDLKFSSLGVDGTKVTIVRPKLSGFRGDGQPYSLTAERAVQDVKQPGRVELHNLTGDIGMAGGETTHIKADAGVYDTVGEHMNLTDNIRIGNSRFDIKLRSAEIDFKSGVYKSADPVEIHAGPGTTIHADRAEARNNGQELTFDGRVRTTIVPQTGEGEAKGANP
jgi:lipopolysaccharide export system protein LptC